MWLGVAELRRFRVEVAGLQGPEPSPTEVVSVTQAYEKAMALDPSSPAARLRLAVVYVGRSGELASLEGGDHYVRRTARSYDQRRSLEAAMPLLQEARTAEPSNAALDHLLASCLFAEGRDPEAHAVLAAALDKDEWNVHDREARRAACRVAELAGLPPMERSQAGSVTNDLPNGLASRHLAYLLTTEADDLRARGDHRGAIARYRAVARMGSLMRRNATQTLQGLVGVAVSRIVSGSFAQRRGTQDYEQVARVRLAGFTSYLRQHGHAAEAKWYEEDMRAADVWKEDSGRFVHLLMPHFLRQLARSGMWHAAAFGIAAAVLVGLAALVGVLSLALRYWREPPAEAAFGYGAWALLLLLAVLPGQIAAFVGPRVSPPDSTLAGAMVAMMVTAPVGAVAWAVVGVIVAARRRLSGRPAFRAALAGLRQLALPTVVALLVLALAVSGCLHHGLVRMDQEQLRIVEQGEVQYWGIGTGHVAPGSGTTQPDSPR
jgi:hypothetical protein